ncbi:uncharacterized protein [Physcomitrium patens]|uniref:uncharacterized protein n=1 Tax=Physcomitrium patens TaxID=3218 RepID=UPI000D177C5B|nr:uncharacterized protein C3orf67 homolog [Physcomitrium patens]|eukprot:XP_024384090.1 uncharacterized protein C3orf67 homolog [Physcomitrella patens]
MYFSTSFNDVKSTPLHCQIPITMVKRDIWLSLSIHVADFFLHCFKCGVFRSVDAIVLGPVCKLRKIFTMRNRLVDAERDCNSSSSCAENSLPPEHMFALGVDNAIQVLDTTSLPMITKNSLDLSNGTPGDLTKTQRNKSNKLEPRQVHVAFGSRMPLPLSTVQINTNLLGDHKLHTNKFLQKEQERSEPDGQNFPFQTEMSSNSCEKKLLLDTKVDKNKTKTLQNLLKHANAFNRNHGMLKFKKDLSSISHEKKNSTIDEHVDMPSNLITSTSFKASNCSLKLSAANSIDDVVLTSMNNEDTFDSIPKDGPTINNLQKPKVHSKQTPRFEALDIAALNMKTIETNTNKAIEQESPTHSMRLQEEFKLHSPKTGSKKYLRRSCYVASEKKKEYKHSKYMDSPPESPPCGWTSHIEDDEAQKSFKMPSFFNKSFASGNDLEVPEDTHYAQSLTSEDIHSTKSLHDFEIESNMAKDLACSNENQYCLNNLLTKHSMKDRVLLASKNVGDSTNDRLRPTRPTNEMFDLGTNDNLMFHDSEFATTFSDEVDSFGRPSWSSNDSQHGQDSQENLENTSQELKTLENEVKNEDMDGHDSIDFDGNTIDGHMYSSKSCTMDQSPRFQKGLRALTLDAQKHSEEMLTPSSSDSMDSINECLKSPFSLQNECELDKEEEITNCVEANDGQQITMNNGHLDEDLDLLYDFTLGCYYDPKTNRYYELK